MVEIIVHFKAIPSSVKYLIAATFARMVTIALLLNIYVADNESKAILYKAYQTLKNGVLDKWELFTHCSIELCPFSLMSVTLFIHII